MNSALKYICVNAANTWVCFFMRSFVLLFASISNFHCLSSTCIAQSSSLFFSYTISTPLSPFLPPREKMHVQGVSFED